LTNKNQNAVMVLERQETRVKKGIVGKLIKSMLIALTMALVSAVVFVCIFGWAQAFFRVSETQSSIVDAGSKALVQSEPERLVPLPEIAQQAVFVTEEDGTLCGCFYTKLDCLEERMEFYMVPLDTRLYLSTELYQELVTKNAKLAQVNTLEELYCCFAVEEAAGCAVKAVDEAVGVQSDYYTVMPKRCYDKIIKEEAETYAYAGFLQDTLQEQVVTAGSMKAYLAGLWEQCECSVSMESRLYYLETYEGLTNLRVSCGLIAGERHNNGYVPAGRGLR